MIYLIIGEKRDSNENENIEGTELEKED